MLGRVLLAAAALCALAGSAPAREDDGPVEPDRPSGLARPETFDITEGQVEAIRRGLQYLADEQARDGSFNEQQNCNVAVTSLALLSLMANGNTESRGKHSASVREGVKFLLRCVEQIGDPENGIPVGYIHLTTDEYSRMHGHGYATTVLALAYGMGDRRRRQEIRKLLDSAIRCIEKSQSDSGGWWYLPKAGTSHEGSITVCQIQALRAARGAGLKVNKATIDRAVDYMVRSQDSNTGGFCYSLTEKQRQSYAITAAALSTLFGLGEYDRTMRIQKGLDYMRRHGSGPGGFARHTSWFFYGNFYAAQALWQAGADERMNHYWREWWPEMREFLVRSQNRRGKGYWSYTGGNATLGVGKRYSTAMATLILQVPLSILPMFQR